ncbi:MAG: bifunctional diguanylate cyclase/phosphodiesterase [Alphaproteobacteria bacterium]|nr:bifunctional diguanylate cyclase/phosphodiesterase [Alphaproteobacteria bacterium]
MSDIKVVKVDFGHKDQISDQRVKHDDVIVGKKKYLDVNEISQIASSIGDICYYWDLVSGEISYSDNIGLIAEYIDIDKVATAEGFAAVMDVENVTNREQAVCHSLEKDFGDGVDYELAYRMSHSDNIRRGYWIEDKGKWFAGKDGQPESACGVMRIVNKRQDVEQQQALYGTHDVLTGFANRIQLSEVLKRTIDGIEKSQKNVAFLLIGIDNLAMINESYGMDVADEVIGLVAKRIEGLMRKTDVIGRYSGNKFGVILHDCSEQNIRITAERLIEAVGQDVIKTADEAVSVSLSAGAVSIPKHSSEAQDIMQYAEETLQVCKDRTLENFSIYEPSVERDNYRRNNIEVASEIVSALNERRVKIVYQPLVHAATGQIESYECLIRIMDRQGEMIPNGQLIPVAERLNLMRLLDNRVLEIALQKLIDEPQVNLGINISGNTIADSSWLDCLVASIGNKPQIGQRLTIEITETTLLGDMAYTDEFVNKLHALGCKVAIDDFGAGYTSFQNLKMLDVDIVKIDGSFISNMRNSADDEFFVRTMNDLAKHFNIKTVAEWVEHEEDVITLRKIGIDYLQGFYFGSGQDELRDEDVLGDMYAGCEEVALPSVG